MLHVVANPAFELDGDSGTGTSYLLYYHCKEGKVQQSTVGYYTDKLRKTPAGWRFVSRQVTILGIADPAGLKLDPKSGLDKIFVRRRTAPLVNRRLRFNYGPIDG